MTEFEAKIRKKAEKGKEEIKPELDEETKKAALLFLEAHKSGKLPKEDRDSLNKAIEQIEQLKRLGPRKSYSSAEIGEILKWLNRPSPNEEKLIKEIENKKKNKKNKKEWCPDESQLHMYLSSRLGLLGKFERLLEEKDI